MSFLELRSITKTYKGSDKPCISDLDLSMEKGEILVVLGKSGCGKTTLLKIISGLEEIDQGDVIVDGVSIRSLPPYKRPISMVFQKPLLFRNLNVGDNVNFSPRVKGTMDKELMRSKTEELLKLVDLEGYAQRKTTELSGGQEQRVSLARALMTEPSILLLDEPFAALDAELRSNMRLTVRRICKELNQTVIFVTHDQQEAVIMGDRIAMMMDGKITQCDRPDVFYHRPVSKKVASFFGWSNSVSAVQDGNTIKCQIGEFIIESAEPYTGDVELMIHPQSVYYSEDGRYSAKVIRHSYLGTSSNYDVEINQTKLTIQLDNRHMFSDGDLIKLDFDTNMIWPVPVSSDDGDDQGYTEPLEERGSIKRLLSRIKKRK